jgi:hypothetical protein
MCYPLAELSSQLKTQPYITPFKPSAARRFAVMPFAALNQKPTVVNLKMNAKTPNSSAFGEHKPFEGLFKEPLKSFLL